MKWWRPCILALVYALIRTVEAHVINGAFDRGAWRGALETLDAFSVNSECLRKSMRNVQKRCDGLVNTNTTNSFSALRVEMAAMVQGCVTFGDTPVRRLRVVAGAARLYPKLQSLSNEFSRATGIPIYFNFSSGLGTAGTTIRAAMAKAPPVDDTSDGSGGYDAFILGPAYLPQAEEAGKLLDLSSLVWEDLQLRWYEINKVFREQMVVYDSKVMAIPITTSLVFLMYHRGIFERDSLTPPQTWDQVLTLAEAYNGKDLNGDGVPDYGICITPPGCFVDGTILQWILSTFVQTQGPSHGVFVDPASVASLANTTAMVQALEVMRRLRQAGPLSGNCQVFEDELFLKGRCLMSLSSSVTFKAAYDPNATAYASMRGKIGTTHFPGSTRVLDRRTMTMAPCSTTTCPLATDTVKDTDGVERLVNLVTPSTNVIVLLNAQSPANYQFFAYSLFSYLASPGVMSDTLLLDPQLETAPLRDQDVAKGVEWRWRAAGYDARDVEEFFNAYREAYANPNQAFEMKFSGNLNLSTTCTIAAMLYTNATPGYYAPPVSVAVNMIQATLSGIIAAAGGRDAFAVKYRRTLNWQAPQALDPSSSSAPAAASSSSRLSPRAVTAVAVAVPCGVVLVGAVVLMAVWSGRSRRRKATVNAAPGAGPLTTLLVSDIQSSTNLWEAFEAAVMDQALSVHHACVRKAIAAWGGYESATEGDSFIIAFHNPTDALCCALAAQQALLEAPWPEQLLKPCSLPGLEGDKDPLMQVSALPLARSAGVGKTQAQRPPAHTTSGGPRAFMSAVQAANASAQSSRGHRRWGALLSLGLGSVDAKGLAMAARDGTASVDSVSVPAGGALSLAGGEDLPSAQHDNLFTKVSEGALASNPALHEARCSTQLTGDSSLYSGWPWLLPTTTSTAAAATAPPLLRHGTDSEPEPGPDSRGRVSTAAVTTAPPSHRRRGNGHSIDSEAEPGIDSRGRVTLVLAPSTKELATGAGPQGEICSPPSAQPSGLPRRPTSGVNAAQADGTATGPRSGNRASPAALVPPRPPPPPQSPFMSEGAQLVPGSGNRAAAVAAIFAAVAAGRSRASGSGVERGSVAGGTGTALTMEAAWLAATGGAGASSAGRLTTSGGAGVLTADAGPLTSGGAQDGRSSNEGNPQRVTGNTGSTTQDPAMGAMTTTTLLISLLQSYRILRGKEPPSPMANATAAPLLLFRGLRVRMGMCTGVASLADVQRNAASGRTHFSGECLRRAKAVSDAAAGGQVLLPEASRDALDGDAMRAARHCLLYMGQHQLTKLEVEEPPLHLYAAYSHGLLPRALVLPPLATGGELRPPVLHAPVGWGTVVLVRVVGADTLLAWDLRVACEALDVLHAAALGLLTVGSAGSHYVSTGAVTMRPMGQSWDLVNPPEAARGSGSSDALAAGKAGTVKERLKSASSSAPGGAFGAMCVVFTDADAAVGWAAALRRALLTLGWPERLMEHELCEEVWAAPVAAGAAGTFGFGGMQSLQGRPAGRGSRASAASPGGRQGLGVAGPPRTFSGQVAAALAKGRILGSRPASPRAGPAGQHGSSQQGQQSRSGGGAGRVASPSSGLWAGLWGGGGSRVSNPGWLAGRQSYTPPGNQGPPAVAQTGGSGTGRVWSFSRLSHQQGRGAATAVVATVRPAHAGSLASPSVQQAEGNNRSNCRLPSPRSLAAMAELPEAADTCGDDAAAEGGDIKLESAPINFFAHSTTVAAAVKAALRPSLDESSGTLTPQPESQTMSRLGPTPRGSSPRACSHSGNLKQQLQIPAGSPFAGAALPPAMPPARSPRDAQRQALRTSADVHAATAAPAGRVAGDLQQPPARMPTAPVAIPQRNPSAAATCDSPQASFTSPPQSTKSLAPTPATQGGAPIHRHRTLQAMPSGDGSSVTSAATSAPQARHGRTVSRLPSGEAPQPPSPRGLPTSPNGAFDHGVLASQASGVTEVQGLEDGGPAGVLLYRGLRIRCSVACGALKGVLVAGDVSGQLQFRGKGMQQAARLMGKAKAGQICATADLARTLLPFLSEELTIIDKI